MRFSGKMEEIERANVTNLVKMQKTAFTYINSLQKQQMITFHSILAIKNDISSLASCVNDIADAVNEHGRQINILAHETKKNSEMIRMTQNEVEKNRRMIGETMEIAAENRKLIIQNTDMINELAQNTQKCFEQMSEQVGNIATSVAFQEWLLTLEEREYDKIYNYPMLRLLRVVNDIYSFKKNNWTSNDILSIKKALTLVKLDPNIKVSANMIIGFVIDEASGNDILYTERYSEMLSKYAPPTKAENYSQYVLENISSPFATLLHILKIELDKRMNTISKLQAHTDQNLKILLKQIIIDELIKMGINVHYGIPLYEFVIHILSGISLAERLAKPTQKPLQKSLPAKTKDKKMKKNIYLTGNKAVEFISQTMSYLLAPSTSLIKNGGALENDKLLGWFEKNSIEFKLCMYGHIYNRNLMIVPDEIYQMLKNYNINPDTPLVYCVFKDGRFFCCTAGNSCTVGNKSYFGDGFLRFAFNMIGGVADVDEKEHLRFLSYDKKKNKYGMLVYFTKRDAIFDPFAKFDLDNILICHKKLIRKLVDSYDKIIEINKTKNEMSMIKRVVLYATEKTINAFENTTKN